MRTSGICALVLLLTVAGSAGAADEPKPPATTTDSSGWGGPTTDITAIIDRVAKRSGKLFIVDPRVRGPVPLTGLDLSKVDYPGLLAILRVNSYVAYENNGVVSVLPDANARQLPIPVTNAVSPQTLDDQWVNVVVNVRNACAAHMVPVLRPMMPQAAHMAAFPQTNSVILSDRADNVRKILDVIERLDKQAAALKQNCTEPSVKSGS
jgi:general secretion pathway protein D